jgi:hypothetical protein
VYEHARLRGLIILPYSQSKDNFKQESLKKKKKKKKNLIWVSRPCQKENYRSKEKCFIDP